MSFFAVKFGGASVNQRGVVEKLRAEGYQLIEVSDGLVVKNSGSDTAVPAALKNSQGVEVKILDVEEALRDPQLSEDARQFMGA